MKIYHVLTRGIEKRKIFLDKRDRLRFIHDLYEFNNEESVNASQLFSRHQCYDVRRRNIGEEKGGEKKKRKLLVDIHVFAIMQNHYHLLLSPRVEKGIFLFMKKLNGGYARYFNQRYTRKGPLFESRYKSILIHNESHFIHIPYYIHCNRLDEIYPEWRKRELKKPSHALEYLDHDRWSSHQDYIGKKNFPSVTQREFLLEYFGGSEGYQKSIDSWLRSFDLCDVAGETLE